jgi:hypothetical protein
MAIAPPKARTPMVSYDHDAPLKGSREPRRMARPLHSLDGCLPGDALAS